MADQYIGVWMGDLITFGGMASAFGTAMVYTYAASRMFYSMAEDGVLPRRLARLDGKQVPRYAVFSVSTVALVVVLAWTFATNIVDAFGAISTWAGLMFLLVYLFVPLAAGRALWGPTAKEKIKAIVVPLIVFAVVGFVLFKSAWPLPTGYLAIVPWLARGHRGVDHRGCDEAKVIKAAGFWTRRWGSLTGFSVADDWVAKGCHHGLPLRQVPQPSVDGQGNIHSSKGNRYEPQHPQVRNRRSRHHMRGRWHWTRFAQSSICSTGCTHLDIAVPWNRCEGCATKYSDHDQRQSE